MTADELKTYIHYDPLTGRFTRLKSNHLSEVGESASYIGHRGYEFVSIAGKMYKAARLACFYMTGSWPLYGMDHKNRIVSDNKWDNLRDIPQSLNRQNTEMMSNNTSGYRGVTWHKAAKKWMASIKIDKKLIYLGLFSTAIAASQAHEAKRLELFTHSSAPSN